MMDLGESMPHKFSWIPIILMSLSGIAYHASATPITDTSTKVGKEINKDLHTEKTRGKQKKDKKEDEWEEYSKGEEDDKGEEDGWGEDEGEDEDTNIEQLDQLTQSINVTSTQASRLFRIDGFTRSQWAVWSQRLQDDALAKARQSLDLAFRYKNDGWRLILEQHVEYDLLYDVKDNFDATQVELYRNQFIAGEQLIAKRLGNVELSTGRQIIAWGEGDGLSALDLINPRDQREPGVSDIDDLRLAVWMSRARWSNHHHELDFVIRHEGNYGLLVPPRADYSPFNSLISTMGTQLPSNIALRFSHDREGVSTETQSYFIRYLHRGEGLDLSLYAGSLLDLQGVLDINPVNLIQQLSMSALSGEKSSIDLRFSHRRYELIGIAGAIPFNQLLFKWEIATSLDKFVNLGNPQSIVALDIGQISYFTGVLSATYSGLTDTTIGLEVQNGFQFSGPDNLLIPVDIPIIALRLSKNLLKERLSVNVIASAFDLSGSTENTIGLELTRGGLWRADASYQLNDSLKLQLGYIMYYSGRQFGPFFGLETHDRIFAGLRWDFTLY